MKVETLYRTAVVVSIAPFVIALLAMANSLFLGEVAR